MGKLLGPGGVDALSVLPGMGRRRRGLFPQANAEGGQGGVERGGDGVEFGYCFDVSLDGAFWMHEKGWGWGAREEGKTKRVDALGLVGRDVRDANVLGGDTGSDTSFLPCLGDAVRRAIPAVAADIAGQLVSAPLFPTPPFLPCLIKLPLEKLPADIHVLLFQGYHSSSATRFTLWPWATTPPSRSWGIMVTPILPYFSASLID